MADDDVFNLLTLPMIALRQIHQGIAPRDLFELLHCSKKTMKTLRPFERRNKALKVGVDFQRNWVEIRGVYKYYALEIVEGVIYNQNQTFDGEIVPIANAGEKAIQTFWPVGDKYRATKKIAQHLINTFGIGTLDQIFISKTDRALEILDWVDRHNLSMDNFNLVGAPAEHPVALAERIFSNEFIAKVNVNFFSLLEVPEDFTSRYFTPINLNKFHAHSAHWITLDDLRRMKVRSIILYNCTLKMEEINKFLEEWIKGSYEKLMYLSLHMKEEVMIQNVVKDLVDPQKIQLGERRVEMVNIPCPSGKNLEVQIIDMNRHFLAFMS